MANNISDVIETYLKKILLQSQSGMIELQRSELADLFQCVPSQINYVIGTRFSMEHGYVVESKRGGGGYIRIRQLSLRDAQPLVYIASTIGQSLTQREAEGMIDRLIREEVVTEREAAMMKAVVRRESLPVELPLRDELRARLFTHMIIAVASFHCD